MDVLVSVAVKRQAVRWGFTLTELLVMIAVTGVLVSLLLVAVQASRDAARRASCANNLRNQALALQSFSAAFQRFPGGRLVSRAAEYSWCVEVLPYLEQGSLAARLDRARPWSAAGNAEAADAALPIFRCPSAVRKLAGKSDYGGILGSILSGASIVGIGLDNGILIEVGPRGRSSSVRLDEVTDGITNTIAIGESSDRALDEGGRWVSGFNCFSQDNGGVNVTRGDDIFSLHPSGANVAFADGKIQFISKNTAEFVIGAICTRSGGEVVNNF